MIQKWKIVRLSISVLLTVALSACSSFAPVYGDRSATSIQSVRFNFAPPTSRVEQIVLNRLKLAFPGEATPADPTLSVAAAVSSPQGPLSTAYAVGRPSVVRVEATATVTGAAGLLLQETRFVDTAYQSGKLTPTEAESSTGVQASAAEAVADALRAALLAKLAVTPLAK